MENSDLFNVDKNFNLPKGEVAVCSLCSQKYTNALEALSHMALNHYEPMSKKLKEEGTKEAEETLADLTKIRDFYNKELSSN